MKGDGAFFRPERDPLLRVGRVPGGDHDPASGRRAGRFESHELPVGFDLQQRGQDGDAVDVPLTARPERGGVERGDVDRGVGPAVPDDRLELLVVPEADEVRARGDLDLDERALESLGSQAVDRIDGLGAGAPAVGPQPVLERRGERLPMPVEESRGILAQELGRPAEVAEILLDPVGPARAHGVDLRAVAVEESHGRLAVQRPLGQLQHPEDGEVGPHVLVHVERRRHVEGVVDAPGDDAGHVPRHGHALAVHDDAGLDPVGRLLELAARRAPGVEDDAVGVERPEHCFHPGDVVLVAGALVPGIVGDEVFLAQAVGEVDLAAELVEPSRQVPVHVPLVARIEAEARPGRPDGEDVDGAERPVPGR